MLFDALVHAPCLRPGARLNIAEANQVEGRQPRSMEVGSEVRLKCGVVAPQKLLGTIVEASEGARRVTMQVGAKFWILARREGREIDAPGLVSEHWIVETAGA